MTYVKLIFALILMAAMGSFGIARAAGATIKPRIVVNSEKVTAADLIEDMAKTNLERARNIFICQAPNPGKSRVLKGDFLKARLAHGGLTELTVPKTITIVRRASVIKSNSIKKAVQNKIRSLLGGAGENVKITFKGKVNDIAVPVGKVRLEVNTGSSNLLRGRVNAQVLIFVDNRKVETKYVDVEISKFVSVWKLKYSASKGKVLAREDIEAITINLTKLRKGPFQNINEIVGKGATRAISGGTILVEGMLESPPVVTKGDVVTIFAGGGALMIKTFGIARKGGKPGDVIPVTNVDSGAKIFARVIDEKSVRAGF